MYNTENAVVVQATRNAAALVAEYLEECDAYGGCHTFAGGEDLAQDIWTYGTLTEWAGKLVDQSVLLFLVNHLN